MKPIQKTILTWLFVICLFASGIYSFVYVIQTKRISEATKQIGAASQKSKKESSPESALKVFVAELEKIDLSYTGAEFKEAFQDYLICFKDSIQLMQSGQSLTAIDAKTKLAHKRLIELTE
jgi:hypothetical protein